MVETYDVIEADLFRPEHGSALICLLDQYARDPMGGAKALSDYTRANLVAELRKRPTVHVLLGLVNQKPAGLTICIEGFSTFACKPLLNIHDIVVSNEHRGKGLARRMLQKAESVARRLGCCKLTLEVLEGNQTARAAYQAYGFVPYELDPRMGSAMFWEKRLDG